MKALFLAFVSAVAASVPLLPITSSQDSQPASSAPVEPVTVIALRHAEKASDGSRDPGLSEAGKARAKSLAKLLAKAGVTHLFSTPYTRTRNTLAPLAKARNLTIGEYSPTDLAGLSKKLSALPPGSVVLVAGHSNTTPALVLDLGGDMPGLETNHNDPVLGETEYDRLFMVTLGGPSRAAKTLELRY